MAPSNEKIALAVSLALSSYAAWSLWFGSPQLAQVANEWSLGIPSYVELFFRHHRAFVLLPVLVVTVWLLPQTRKHRGWLCLGIGLLSMLFQASIWVPVFMAPAVTG